MFGQKNTEPPVDVEALVSERDVLKQMVEQQIARTQDAEAEVERLKQALIRASREKGEAQQLAVDWELKAGESAQSAHNAVQAYNRLKRQRDRSKDA